MKSGTIRRIGILNGEIILVGPGKTNVFMVNQNTYHLVEGDFLLVWPMEMHAIIDADRKESLVIQFSNVFIFKSIQDCLMGYHMRPVSFV